MSVSSDPTREFDFVTFSDKLFARCADPFGHKIPQMPSAQMCLDAINGSHILVIDARFPKGSVDEVEIEMPNGRKVMVLEIHPSQFAWLVGAASEVLPTPGAAPADQFIRDVKLSKRPVRA